MHDFVQFLTKNECLIIDHGEETTGESRTLKLSGNSIKELPEEIGELIHLRHIDLSYSRILETLPDTICGLYNLSTLRFVKCSELKKLPENMGNLINLKHLYVESYNNLKSLPKGIGRLTSLQTLDVCRCWWRQ
ncbi:unnamed protein product [Prunus armeniaca]|uniref:Disease resistance R13L4/SHOC-2-like LRR domain-containing protein n=1 Tax=Prunus armeniaca TaxID=36596 RepID=A0A6J5TTZ5_PRUAR|nr:unnamed protein product [Prunus armeniaca]